MSATTSPGSGSDYLDPVALTQRLVRFNTSNPPGNEAPCIEHIKSLLDGFCSLALASSLGVGVLASVVTIAVYQGALSLLASLVAEPLDEISISLMTAVGGVILLATALMILDIKKIPVANMLPGIFLPPLVVWATEQIAPGLLLPLA